MLQMGLRTDMLQMSRWRPVARRSSGMVGHTRTRLGLGASGVGADEPGLLSENETDGGEDHNRRDA